MTDAATRTVVEPSFPHALGFVGMPPTLPDLPTILPSRAFMAPARISFGDYFLRAKGDYPDEWSAATAAAQMAEALLWRRDDAPAEIDPAPVYSCAKLRDGAPGGKGTTLLAALDALRHLGIVGGSSAVRLIRRNRLAVRYALHRCGLCLGSFNMSSAWLGDASALAGDCSPGEAHALGSHAVVLCGYDKDGVSVMNPWGCPFGNHGMAKVSWARFDREFVYGACLWNARGFGS